MFTVKIGLPRYVLQMLSSSCVLMMDIIFSLKSPHDVYWRSKSLSLVLTLQVRLAYCTAINDGAMTVNVKNAFVMFLHEKCVCGLNDPQTMAFVYVA